MFTTKKTIKIYRKGDDSPHIVFSVESGHISLIDHNILNCDGSTITFDSDSYIIIE